MEISINVGNKGINTDLDEYILDNQTLRYAQNIRLSQNGDNNYIIQNVDGNEIEFTLTNGFIPIGYVNDNFTSYIFSYNPLTQQGEIGSYPSLNYEVEYLIDNSVESIYPYALYPENHHVKVTNRLQLETEAIKVNKYNPLFNYSTDDNLLGYYAFRSRLFNFSLDKPIVREAVSKQHYDYSFNLYFTDNKNPVRVINSSILEYQNKIKLNKKLYKPSNFTTDINLILGSTTLTSFNLPIVTEGGGLKAGNYTFYLIYNVDGVKTNPICNTNKISIYYTQDNLNYGGSNTISFLTEQTETEDLRTNKQINLSLSNVDTGYSKFRLWVEYNDGFDFANSTFYEIDIDYIVGQDVTIRGYEPTIPLSESQINKLYYDLFKAKTLTHTDSRLFAGNISVPEQDIDAFKQIAYSFIPEFIFNQNVFDINTEKPPYIDETSNNIPLTIDNAGYAHYINTYLKLGYWGGETYSFAVVFKLKNGTETQAFSITGKDFTKDTTDPEYLNDKGLVKFPHRFKNFNGNTIPLYDYNTNRFKGLSLNIIIPPITHSDIIGYKIVRADRIKHCISQGYLFPTYSVLNGNLMSGGTLYTGEFQNAYGGYNNRVFNNGVFTNNSRKIYISDSNNIRRVIPAPYSMIETERSRIGSTLLFAPSNHWFSARLIDDYRYAFYSIDTQNDRTIRTVLNDNNVDIKIHNKIKHKFYNLDGLLPIDQVKPTLMIPMFFEPINKSVSNNRCWQVDEGREITNGKFSSKVSALEITTASSALSNHNFEQYTGIITNEPLTEGTNNPFINIGIDDNFNLPVSIVGDYAYAKKDNNNNLINPVSYGGLLVNLYENENLKPTDIYPDVTQLQYKSITDYIAPSNTMEIKTIYGGDCYVGFMYKKLWFSDQERNQAVTDSSDPSSPQYNWNGRTGLITLLISENNTNPFLRANEIIDINERNQENNPQRTYYPLHLNNDKLETNIPEDTYTNLKNQTGNWQITNYVKQYRIPESKRQNKGYNISLPSKRYTLNDNTIDFISNNFITRVIYSEQQVGLTLKDSYRDIGLLNTQDYDITRGQIYSLKTQGGQVVAVQEGCVTFIPYKERIPINKDEQIFVDGVGVLTPYAKYIDNYGTQNTHSIVKSDNTIYGVDVKNRKIWRIEGEQLRILSDMTISAYLSNDKGLDRLSVFPSDFDEVNNIQVRTYYDRYTKEVLFCFYHKDYPESTFTICFNEMLNVFTSFYTFTPNLIIRKGKNLFSAKVDTNTFYKHNIETGSRNTFYDEFNDTIIEFVVNNPTDISKVFDNHYVVSNNIYPSKIKWETENQIADRTRDWLLKMKRLRQEENRVFVVIGSSDTDKGENYNHSRLNSRIRDKYVKVRFNYDTVKKLRIEKITTKYRRSNV